MSCSLSLGSIYIYIYTTTTVYFNECFSQYTGVNFAYGLPQNIFLHLDLSQASSLQSLFSFISSLNTSLHLFLGLPFTALPSTCSVSIQFSQHNSSFLSIWPKHLSLFHCMTSPMSSIASMFLTYLLLFPFT